MSRWSRRSQADKNAIELQRIERESVAPKSQSLKKCFDDADAVAILKQLEIPIACPHCLRFRSCDKYELGMFKTILTGDTVFPAIQGRCNVCHNEIRRVQARGGELIIWMAIFHKLRNEGRLSGTWTGMP